MTAERPRFAIAAVVLLVLGLGLVSASAARAQGVKPWVPPSADSLARWASEAKVQFQTNRGDSVGGENLGAYERVGLMGRRLLRSLGRGGMLQAHALKTVIDSLGLDVDVSVDPTFPEFVLLMVRNPYRRTAQALGFIYWYRDTDLRMQGAMFMGGVRPTMRVWWTGYPGQPYSMGVVDHDRDPATGRVHVTLLRMAPQASVWSLLQGPTEAPDFEGSGEAMWTDINDDGRPELVAWVRAENDSVFEACASCPHILHEHVYAETRDGLELEDFRLVPTPYSIFTLFVRHLADGNRAAAARLLADPAKVDEAVAAGWGSRRRAKAWMLEYAEDERWPHWLAFVHHGPQGDQRYIVHFEMKEGRWIIRDWVKPHLPPRAGQGAPADTATARTPGSSRPKPPRGTR